MQRQLHPAEASQQATDALAAAGFKGLAVNSWLQGNIFVTTTVRVNAGDATRVLAVLRALPYAASSGQGWKGKAYEVWISRRVNMAG
jgi:hypothetical protein